MMGSVSIHQFVTIFTWFGLTALLFMLALIARKYEILSGERTYFQLYAVPALAFAGATIRQAQQDQIVGDSWSNVFLLAGGVTLAGLCLHLYRRMTS